MTKEDQFAELLSKGLTMEQIALRMGLRRTQAANYLRRIKAKLGWQAQ